VDNVTGAPATGGGINLPNSSKANAPDSDVLSDSGADGKAANVTWSFHPLSLADLLQKSREGERTVGMSSRLCPLLCNL